MIWLASLSSPTAKEAPFCASSWTSQSGTPSRMPLTDMASLSDKPSSQGARILTQASVSTLEVQTLTLTLATFSGQSLRTITATPYRHSTSAIWTPMTLKLLLSMLRTLPTSSAQGSEWEETCKIFHSVQESQESRDGKSSNWWSKLAIASKES